MDTLNDILLFRMTHIDNVHLNELDQVDIQLYEPRQNIKEILNKERANLTPARAILLAVLYDMVHNGEFVSEFSAEKVACFIQRLGDEKYFHLRCSAGCYGPYSGKVKYVLN